MTIENMQTISMVSFIAAAVMLILAVALFFLLDVPRLIGDITGATARKAIEAIRQQNEESGGKVYKSSAINLNRGMVTDKISASGRLIRRQDEAAYGLGTSKLSTMELAQAAADSFEGEISRFDGSEETTLLDNFDITDTRSEGDYKEIYKESHSPETTVLSEVDDDTNSIYSIEVDMSYSSSSEVIE